MKGRICSALLLIGLFLFSNVSNAANPELNKELYRSVQFQDVPKIKELLAKGADANFTDTNRSMLGWAAQGGNLQVVEALIAAKANLNFVDGVGHTPLMRAIETQQTPIVKALIAAKAKLDTLTRDGKTTLMMAVDSRKPEIVQALIDGGVDVKKVTAEGDSPALVAAQDGSPESLEIIKILGKAKANLDASNLAYTPLTYAISQDNKDLVRALLEAGANPNAKTKSGHSPLYSAISNSEIVKLLIAAKANPNLTNDSGDTVLMAAIESGTLDDVDALIKAGADVNLRNSSGSSPLSVANNYMKPEIAELLKKHGAQP